MKRSRPRKIGFWLANIVLLVVFLPLFVHFFLVPAEFNQFLIQKLEIRYGHGSKEIVGEMLRSTYSSGLNVIRHWPSRTKPKLEDPEAVFSYVFSWVPLYSVVYPTEGFFYWKTDLDEHKIMGNIRLADAHKGKVSFAYFTVPDKKTFVRNWTAEDGLGIKMLSKKLVELTWKGKTVRFRINEIGNQPPKVLPLLAEEEFSGHVQDESGIRFFLIFNGKTKSFYFIADEEEGANEPFFEIGDGLEVGKRSGFMYYRDNDYGRKLLVGVAFENIAANNYFDGPGDQVPYDQHLRPKIHLAYPHTLLGEGIDEHGVYINTEEWMRIAISPYHRFKSPQELQKRLRKCADEKEKSEQWTCLTKEWWNNPLWLKRTKERLAKEGKKMPEDLGF